MDKKQLKETEGFSLTELLVVVAIVALLLVLAAGIFIRQLAKANDARRKSDLNKMKIAIEEYEKDHDCYPEVFTICGGDSGIPIHPYLNNVPCDPKTKQPYTYEVDDPTSSCPKWFRLYASFENSEDPKYIPDIGPDGLFSYYVSSENAPPLETGGGGGEYNCSRWVCNSYPPAICVTRSGYTNDSGDCETGCNSQWDTENTCLGGCNQNNLCQD